MLVRSIARQSVRSFSRSSSLLAADKTSFSDKERAEENVYVKKHEAEQLKALKEQLAKQKETIDKLSEEIKNIKK